MQHVLDEVRPLAEAFVAADHPLYLVGGVVRDLLLGKERAESADVDLCTPAHPDEIKRIVGPLADAAFDISDVSNTALAVLRTGGQAPTRLYQLPCTRH